MSEATSFIWKGQARHTIGDLLDAMFEIHHAEEAAYFIDQYRQVNEHADKNVGYILGYVEPPERRREMYALFNAYHPIFGGTP